ncbi:MAG: AAA family ATPase, partial [Deltaproteobacteria bacterium]|nr:AAA family ATPase [Deltaproteobacteria bacterium]
MHLDHIIINQNKFPTRKHYPFNLKIFQETKEIVLGSPVSFFIGENGTGKSTLLKALAYRCGIYIWKGTERKRCEVNLYEEELYRALDIEWSNGKVPGSFFASQIFHNYAQIVDEWASADPLVLDYFGGKSLMTQSHGQSLMSYFKTRYLIKGIYFLDEPETALSPRTQLELLNVLKHMGDAGHAQFIIATHSPILMACPGADIFSFDHIPVGRIEYEDTQHYRIYKNFFEN